MEAEEDRAPDQGWIEMLTEIKVGPAGTPLDVTHVDHEAAGKHPTLTSG